ncbi:flagellar biosynthetic protein FliR [Lachnospiraceae bacterium ZAX-1]
MVNYSFTLVTFEYFLMILVRIASFVYVAPFFGMTNTTPNRVKIGFSALVALVLYQLVLPKNVLEYTGVIEYAVIVVKEGITGVLIGLGANICNSIIAFSGKMIDMEIGLSMASMFDPINNTQSGVSGTLYNNLIMLLLVVTDMHHYILRAAIDSFQVIPVNEVVFDWDHLLLSMATYMLDMLVIGFRIILPIFACSLILNCILGILAKVSPQMNMFAIGMQLKVLIGLIIMFVSAVLLPDVANFIFTEMKKMMVLFIEGMY